MAKEENPKFSHQLYKRQIKSTQFTGQTLSYGICKRTMRGLTEENALVLTAVDIGDKNTQEYNQIRVSAALSAGPETSPLLEGILGK